MVHVGPDSWIRRRRVARAETACVSAFHLIVAAVIAFAPRHMVITPGTSVAFGFYPPTVWAVWFAVTGIVAGAMTHRNTLLRQAITWCGVFPLGCAFEFAFLAALSQGRGNAVFAIMYPFLLMWWLALAIRLHNGGAGTRWDGS